MDMKNYEEHKEDEERMPWMAKFLQLSFAIVG